MFTFSHRFKLLFKVFAAVILSLGVASLAHAHTGDFVEGVTVKANGSNIGVNEVLNSTPRVIVVDVGGDTESSISVTNLDGVNIIPRSTPRVSGKYLVFEPPVLDPGTYAIKVTSPSVIGENVSTTVFIMKRSSGVFFGVNDSLVNNYKIYLYPLGGILIIFAGVFARFNFSKINSVLLVNMPDRVARVFSSHDPDDHNIEGKTEPGELTPDTRNGSGTSILGLVVSGFVFVLGFLGLFFGGLEYGVVTSFLIGFVLSFLGLVTGFTLRSGVSPLSLVLFIIGVVCSLGVMVFVGGFTGLVIGFIVFNIVLILVLFTGLMFSKVFTSFAGVVMLVSFVGFTGGFYVNPTPNVALGGFSEEKVLNVSECLQFDIFPKIEACIQDYYKDLTESKGTVEALNALDEDKVKIPGFLSFCHEASHTIGRAAYNVEGSVPKAFEIGFDVCDFGFYHGVIEGSSDKLTDDEFRSLIASLCSDLASSSELFFGQCAHGVGHAASRRSNNDLVKGFSFCEAFDNANVDERLRRDALGACGTGVSMEWFAKAGAQGADLNDFLPEVSFLPDACLEVPSRWQPDCFEYVGNTVDSSRPVESLKELTSLCNESPAAEACFKGLARAAGGLKVGDSNAVEICALASSDLAAEQCVLMYVFVVAATVEYDLSAVDRICNVAGPRFASACDLGREAARNALT